MAVLKQIIGEGGHPAGRRLFLLCAVLISVVPGLAGCDTLSGLLGGRGTRKARPAPKAKVAQKVPTSKRVKELEARLARLLAPEAYRFSPAGKPDPFRPFMEVAGTGPQKSPARSKKGPGPGAKPEKCATVLECIDVGQLTLVAIVREADGTRLAMAQDAAGVGYTLREGDRVGYRGGRVTRILKDRVVVTEKVENVQGKLVPMDRVLLLYPEE
ncbi:pilus assembly protein PilP [Dissulfurirhabdus thermomarina]|uniref:Pilus assembly protein PilP n=1 Tax=Dissulfurirhabdus thermomarina TaxID=1765737 RepID=A0A6N9TNL9_DISTH|nr:pilus assembly protein PilP [Dissulfurirhabdus thermomarina]NDY42749.1 pilus assembly protein PilP [Dissulfurirhabdus thermomarina]NMX22449.1 pilus assembly protein PilP [Dissulfurirhabdus thermomarina]